MFDTHIHTTHSPDSRSTMEEYIERALTLGYRGIGFSEHLEFDPADPGHTFFHYDRYSAAIDAMRRKYEGRLIILKGIEVTYQREFHKEIADYIQSHPFDFVIGSVHFVDRVAFYQDDRYFRGKTPEQAFVPYFEEVLRTAQSGLFDVLGHLDHLRRYFVRLFSGYSHKPYDMWIDRILKTVATSSMSLEVNFSGYREPQYPQPFPETDILRRFVEVGGRFVTTGSDSHGVDRFHTGMPETIGLLKSLGLKEASYFIGRRRETWSL